MRPLGGRALSIAALAAALVAATGGEALAQADTTAPTLNVATLSPSPATGHNGWYRGPVTLNLTATDEVGVVRFQYSLNSGGSYTDVVLPAPATAAGTSVEITQEGLGNNAVRYRAVDAAGNTSPARAISVRIDTRPPLASWPAIVDGRVGHAARLVPSRPDVAPGSGGVAVLDMVLDGEPIHPLPLTTSDLSLGAHTLALRVGDAAGNAAWHTQTFVVTTSFADVGAIITAYAADGRVTADVEAPAPASRRRSR
jgi:hypothetical protein